MRGVPRPDPAEAAVALRAPEGVLGTLCATDPVSRRIDELQFTLGEGPSLDAFVSGRPVLAIPLRLRDSTVGALNLFSFRTAPIPESDLLVGRAFADLAAISIVQRKLMTEAQGLNEQPSAALHSRIVIEQAKGVVSERAGVGLPEAFARLRTYARARNLRLTDVAHAAVEGTLDPVAWSEPAAGAGD